jgi:tRNA nucleotidyltransferase (CCA-adding enzyme)
LSPVVEKIFEIENPDAYFAVFSFKHNGSALIISRNQKDSIELDHLMGAFGGGGHKKAASATVKGVDGKEVFRKLEDFLESSLLPALTASDLMTPEVDVIAPGVSLVDAAMFLEEIDHTGCPVVEEDGHLVGFITLRDIMKGRRAGQMHAPVKGYMTRKVIHTGRKATVREIEDLLLTNNIGHLPILDGEKMVGIVTRTDYLLHRKEEKEQIQAVKDSLQ